MKNVYVLFTLLMFCAPRTKIEAQVTNNLTATNVVPDWTKSIVKIWYECSGKIFTGAGVIVSKSGYILTAAHVGRDCNTISDTKIKVGTIKSAYSPPQQIYNAKFVNSITDNVQNPNVYDLKLLKIDTTGGVTLTPAVFSATLPLPGDDISIAGFPDLPFAFLNQNEASLSIYKTGVLSCFAESNNNIPTRIHYGGNALPGFSGGAIFDKNGHLVGIHSTRSTASITNLLNTTCPDAANTQKPCWGNAIRFKVLTSENTIVTQEVYIDYNALKTVLDNYSWGTSIWRIPQAWLTLIQQ
jgi:Trypsin-like serine proteases, typically periplasmic, contain C-terminal PDZ domain